MTKPYFVLRHVKGNLFVMSSPRKGRKPITERSDTGRKPQQNKNYKTPSGYRVDMTSEKINMSFQPKTLKKLDRLRGVIPRSTFLSHLVEIEYRNREAKE